MTTFTRTMQAIALMLVALAGLAGCGQKGPLYLPEDSAAKQQKTQ